MNMLGKILTVLIFIMSIFFMAFSFMVFMTQTSWEDKTKQAKDDLSVATQANRSLQADITKIQTQRAAENAARTNAIALLEANLANSEQARQKMDSDLRDLRSTQQQQGAQVTGSLATLQAERNKVDTLRETVKAAQAERDKMFAEVVDLKDKVLELEAIRQRLSASETALLDQVSKQVSVLRANDLSADDDISGLPPTREGKVKVVDGQNKYVVVSLGSDDGMRKGHVMDVHRRDKYLGKIQITKTHPDRSIGVILNDYRKGAIMGGDSVRTR